ncbi:MAG: hypothetical protein FWC17_01365 [Treponema sp.]|nr:hypothetical protein [Treponema sp.]
MNKKILFLLFFILLLCAGFIALTQEMDFLNQSIDIEKSYALEKQEPVKWFRSNSGAMALEETFSKSVAFRNEYVLSIETARFSDIPEYLLEYFSSDFTCEIRVLYKNEEPLKTQWLFKDSGSITRMNAVFNDTEGWEELYKNNELVLKDGFIEIFDSGAFLISEYRYYNSGIGFKIDYTYNENMLTSCAFFIIEEKSNELHEDIAISLQDQKSGYKLVYADFYRYNRSLSLRSMERVFYAGMQITQGDPLRIDFPRNTMDAIKESGFITGRINAYSDFFGDVYSDNNYRMIYENDERGRIITQSFLDDNDNIIWIIKNVWNNNRIVSSEKREGGVVLLAEYEYSGSGERITEKNYRNGMLERLVRTEGNVDIEELYFNNVLVLRAVWEDGRKISETRIR